MKKDTKLKNNNRLKLVSVTLIAFVLTITACSDDSSSVSDDPTDQIQTRQLDDGTISTITLSDISIHSFEANDSALQSSHILETANTLIILDTTISTDFSDDVKSYADELGKPIDRVIISHAHRDHFGGAATFDGIPFYSTENVINSLNTAGFTQAMTTLPLGDIVIDNLTLNIDEIADNEADFNLVIDIPSQQAVYLNDLVYNNVHLVTLADTLQNWIETLEGFKTRFSNYRAVLSGHGSLARPDVIQRNIDYLNFARNSRDVSDNAEEYADSLIQEYPDWSVPAGIFTASANAYWVSGNSVPGNIDISGENVFMEGLAVYGISDVYTNSFTTGEIRRTNYSNSDDEIFAAGRDDNTISGWGLAIDAENRQLLALRNGPLSEYASFFADPVNGVIQSESLLLAFDLTSGEEIARWTLPAGSSGNAIAIDNNGYVYVSDLARGHIIRIDRQNNSVDIWSNTALPLMGGIVFDGQNSLYIHGGFQPQLIQVGINEDGTAQAPQPIALSGSTFAGTDGLAWAGNNTLITTVNSSSIATVVLDGSGNGFVSEIVSARENFFPTSLAVVPAGLNNILYYNNGQLGVALSGNTTPSLPFQVLTQALAN